MATQLVRAREGQITEQTANTTCPASKRAEAEGADYLGVSPIFETPTKTDSDPATGLAGLVGG